MDEQIIIATRQWTQVLPVVSAYVTSIVRDFSIRDDLLQEIAVAVIRSYHRFDATQPFRPWALAIARNQVRNYLRQKKRDRLVFGEQLIAILADSFDQRGESYSRQLDHLQSCLAKLDEKAQRLVFLRYHEQMKPAAIAEHFCQTSNGISKALQRIRDQLRACVMRISLVEESPK